MSTNFTIEDEPIGSAPRAPSLHLPSVHVTSSSQRFARFAWWSIFYTILVILFGAWVRITGSGAGCGQHWPTCKGEVLHIPQTTQTVIELTHRLTSGIDGILVLILFVASFRVFAKGHRCRHYATISLIFLIIEALLGAGLAKFELVENNSSYWRAIAMSVHLVNTLLLLRAMLLTAWWATPSSQPQQQNETHARTLVRNAIGVVIIVSLTGAFTALGDTVFPVTTMQAVLEVAGGEGIHFLRRLRILHPILATAGGGYMIYICTKFEDLTSRPVSIQLSKWLAGIVFLQIALGFFNIALSAPGWMQIIHLATSNILWSCLILLAASLRQMQPAD